MEKQIKSIKKKVDGPKVNDTMATTVTLGVLTGNSSDSLSRQMRAFLSPLLLKSQDTGQNASPLSIRASQYSLWRITKCEIHFFPLVGRANVGGSVLFAALDQDATASQAESPDSIKAKYHVELSIGNRVKWNVPSRFLRGPRDGWWGMDTGESATSTVGCALDFWILYQTVNIMQASGSSQIVYTKPIYSVEVRVSYQFSGYEPKTALSQMTNSTVTTSSTVQMSNASDGSLVMVASTTVARCMEEDRPHRLNAQSSGVGEKLWAIATAAVEGAASALGPWGWLLRGGFWLVRKFFGAAGEDTTDTYMVYASIEDADKDNRIFQTVTQQTLNNGPVRVMQISTPNVNQLTANSVGAGPSPPAVLSYLPLPSAEPELKAYVDYKLDGTPANSWKSHQVRVTGFPKAKILDTSTESLGYNSYFVTGTKWIKADYTDTGVVFGFPHDQSSPQASAGLVGVTHTSRTLLKLLTSIGPDGEQQRHQPLIKGSALERLGGSAEFTEMTNGDIYWCFIATTQRTTKPTSQSVPTELADAWGMLLVNLTTQKVWVVLRVPNSQGSYPKQQLVLTQFDKDQNWEDGRVYCAPLTSKQQIYPLPGEPGIDDEEDDDISVSSLFEPVDPENEVEKDFSFKCSLKSKDYLIEEAKFWKQQAEQLMIEKAMASGCVQTPLVRFEKGGP